jgi:low temperature requirement protein LtrA
MNVLATLRRLRAELWQAPRGHGEILHDRTVGPLELFYDLVVVVLVAQAAHRFSAHVTPHGLAEFAVLFTIIWIAWLNGTLLHDLHGRDDIRGRNTFLAQILLLVPLGACLPTSGDLHGRAFAIIAALLFLLLSFLWWRVSRADTAEYARPTRLYIATTLACSVGLGASAPLAADLRLTVWAALDLAFLVSVAVVIALVPGRLDQAVAVTDALVERFGLLVIIVLGETVTGVVSGLNGDPTDAHKIAVALVCVVVGFGSWWTYFDFVGHRMPRRSRTETLIWLLGHLPVSAAIAGIGATMPLLIEHAAAGRAPSSAAWMLCGSAAVLLVFTSVLMTSVQDWTTAPSQMRPLAAANLVAGVVMIAVAPLRPSPLVLGIVVVLTLGGPWTLAVVRRSTEPDPNGTPPAGRASADVSRQPARQSES